VTDDDERELGMEWLRMQLKKAPFDMDLELRKLKRQSLALGLSAASVVIAAFAAGAAAWHFFH
jgi:hypothetical protein